MRRRSEKRLSGWGRYSYQVCEVVEPLSISSLREAVTGDDHPSCIPRGLGRSYGDASLNDRGAVLLQTHMRRFLAFDEATGVLECEGGITLAEIIEHFLPRGWFLPTTPGTKHVTVGGAIAADIHGKNHHADGSLGNFVASLKLLLASGETLECSPLDNAEVFWATIGGMGLTGVILSARLQLRQVESAYYDLDLRRTADLDETLEQLDGTEREYRYSVAWVDCLASGVSLGRSVVMLANDARVEQLPREYRPVPLRIRSGQNRSLPFAPPFGLVNRWSVKGFNSLYYALHRDRHSIVDYDSFFYPLDRLTNWNRVYGKRGFVQYQALFPRETARRGLVDLLERIASSGQASFVSVLKSSGHANRGLLSYLFRGYTLALDLPNTGERLRKLACELDGILLRHGGRLYLAKDSLTTAETFAAMYPPLKQFREIKNRLDPEGRFASSQARRVGIVASL